jgi:peptidoglycan/xylan/chitin deacetylase (PgdA/CDA1 family)
LPATRAIRSLAKGEMLEQIKRFVKFAISALFYFCSSIFNFVRALAGAEVPATCVVLHFHTVSTENRERFSRHMEAVRRWTIPLPADNRRPLTPGKRYSVITFDDGFQSANENGIPELIRQKIPVTVFLSPDLLGTTPKWATFDGDELEDEQIVSAEDLKKWPADLVTVGSHTLTHAWLPSSPEGEVRVELSRSRQKLSQLLNKDADLFSFPYGASTDRLVELCREAGYRRVFTNIPNLAFSDPEEFVTGRLTAEPTDWPLEFRLKLLGAYRWFPVVSAWKKRLLPGPPGPTFS